MLHYLKLAGILVLVTTLFGCEQEATPLTLPTLTELSQPKTPELDSSQTTQTTSPSTDSSTTDTTSTTQTEDETTSVPDISTVDLFVDYMNTLLETLASLDDSLTNNIDLQSQSVDEELLTSLNVIKENLLAELQKTRDHILALPLPSDDVAALKVYMHDAYTHTLSQIELEYTIVLIDKGENVENIDKNNALDSLRITAIQNAKEEISRLSNDAYYSK